MQTYTDAYFLLVGDGSETERLRLLIKNKKLQNIAIYDAVGQKDYLSMLSEFDIGLLSLDRKFRTANFPGKLLGYIYYAMPVLASINLGNDLQTLLEKGNAGLVSLNGNDEALFNNALKLLHDEALRKEYGKNARVLLDSTFSVKGAARQVMSHFGKGHQPEATMQR